MGIIDRLGNLAKGTVRVQQQAWEEGGGLEGRLERLKDGADELRQTAAEALRPAESDPEPAEAAAARPAPARDPLAEELLLLDQAFAAGKMTRSELRRKQAEARARFGGSDRRTL